MARTPEQLLDVTLQPALFLVIFTYIFGGAIAAGSQHDYLQYLLPGLLGQSIALGGVAIGVNLNSDLEKGIFDRFRSLPIARSAPLIGAVMADVVRCALAVAFALCFCWISVWVGMVARTSGAVQGITMLLVFPLTFASNTFVKTDTLPDVLQAFANANPLSQLVEAVRGLLLGGPVGSHVMWTFAWMGGLLLVFVPLALRAYGRRA